MSQIDQNRSKTVAKMNAENKRNEEFGSDRLIEKIIADQYKEALVSVTGSLKAYAEAFHNKICTYPDVPFSACPSVICRQGNAAIDKAIAIIASNSIIPVKEG